MLKFTERFLTYSLPLYVRLLAEEARALHSFTDTTKLCLPVDCAEAIDDLFLRLVNIVICFRDFLKKEQ